MASATLRRRLAALEYRQPSGRFGVVEVPPCHPSEHDAMVKRIVANLPEGSQVCIVPACCTSDDQWNEYVAWTMEWQAANEAWDRAISEGRARCCEPCDKRFVRNTQVCPGCGERTTEGF
jgi:hypothetical protein